MRAPARAPVPARPRAPPRARRPAASAELRPPAPLTRALTRGVFAVARDSSNGASRRLGIVAFSSPEALQSCVQSGHVLVKGAKCRVVPCEPRSVLLVRKPRRSAPRALDACGR